MTKSPRWESRGKSRLPTNSVSCRSRRFLSAQFRPRLQTRVCAADSSAEFITKSVIRVLPGLCARKCSMSGAPQLGAEFRFLKLLGSIDGTVKLGRAKRRVPGQWDLRRAHLVGWIPSKTPAAAKPWRAESRSQWRTNSAVGFGSLFLFGLFFLFFFLQLIADNLENRNLRSVADADACVDNSRIASGAVREFRRDFAEELLCDGGSHEIRRRLPPRLQSVALAERDDLFRHGPCGFRARQRGGNPSMLKQIRNEVPQRRATVRRITSKF